MCLLNKERVNQIAVPALLNYSLKYWLKVTNIIKQCSMDADLWLSCA
jgi:hypothetical protein